jgi:hypothetical protein
MTIDKEVLRKRYHFLSLALGFFIYNTHIEEFRKMLHHFQKEYDDIYEILEGDVWQCDKSDVDD